MGVGLKVCDGKFCGPTLRHADFRSKKGKIE